MKCLEGGSAGEYLKIRMKRGEAYIARSIVEELGKIKAVIFDCDGVLIDVKDSYDKAIGRTVSYIMSKLTGFKIPERLVSRKVVYGFRRSGGFNNDWDTTYIVLMHLFSRMPEGFLNRFTEVYKASLNEISDPAEASKSASTLLRDRADRDAVHDVLLRVEDDLVKLASRADASGIPSVEKFLFEGSQPEVAEGLSCFKRFLGYPGEVGRSLLVTLFEEVYCGAELFKETHSVEPKFGFKRALVEDERMIVTEETLRRLEEVYGRSMLAIASGRGYNSFAKIMGPLTWHVNMEASVFFADLLLKGFEASFGKPEPHLLLRVADALGEPDLTMYVGDSMEDLVMVERANKFGRRFLSAGVYGNAYSPKQMLELFLSRGVDVALPNVNFIPDILAEGFYGG